MINRSIVCSSLFFWFILNAFVARVDIRRWHGNIEQHASESVNKILIGNKSDRTDKRAVPEELGRGLARELGVRFMETSAKLNEGVEEAFFTLARLVVSAWLLSFPLTLDVTAIARPDS